MTSDFDTRAFLQDYVRLMDSGRLDQAGRFLRPDYVEEYPQSGERIRGLDNLLATIRAYPGGPPTPHGVDVETTRIVELEQGWSMTPAFTLVRLAGSGDVCTSVVRMRYPDASWWWAISIHTLAARQIARSVTYFAPQLEAPAWRARYVERFDPLARTDLEPSARERSAEPVDARRHFEAWVAAINNRRYDDLREVLHDDCVQEWPQSGERVPNPDALVAILSAYPGLAADTIERDTLRSADEGWLLTPFYTVVRVVGTGDTRTATFRARYPDGSRWWIVVITTFRGQRAARSTTFWAPEFEAPEWRAPFVERFDR
jgi:hypothetical protein